MCGAPLAVKEGSTVVTCEYCGSTQTVPLIDYDKKLRLFTRANEYRLNNEFDKAYDAFEQITIDDPNEAEAYWGMVLSEFGVEYVDDPKTGKKVATCHRTINESIYSNTNYKEAIENASSENRFIYQDEAEVISNLQKRIYSISHNEKPYDVFICYKEKDDRLTFR